MPLSEQEIKELLEKAESYMKMYREVQGDDLSYLKQALECYNQIIENALPHPHYFYKRAEIKRIIVHRSPYYISGALSIEIDIDDVIKDMDRAIELDPDKGFYYFARGIFMSDKLKRYENINDNPLLEKVIADYQASLERDPLNPTAWLALMEINILTHNWDDAISIYGQCKPYINDKEDRLRRSWLGCLVLALGGDPIEEEDIKPLYDQTIRMGIPSFSSENISSLLNKIGKKEAYKTKWEKAMEIHKLFIDHFDGWLQRGIWLGEINLYEEAIKAYKQAIYLEPNNALAWSNLGINLRKLNCYEEALEAFSKSAEICPNDLKAWKNVWRTKIQVFSNYNRYEEALKVCEESINYLCSHNDHTGALYIYDETQKLLFALNRYGEALEALNKATELFCNLNLPNNALYVYTETQELLFKHNRYDEALEAFHKTLEILRRYYYYDYGTALCIQTVDLWADEEFIVITMKPEFAGAWYEIACAYLLKGDKEVALASLAKAIELDAKYKENAKKDGRFKNLWEDEDFKKIVM